MKRDAYKELLRWKEAPGAKPLLLNGARQVGKTWLLKEFARNEFTDPVYLDFEEDPKLDGLFGGSLSPERLLADLQLYTGRRFGSGSILILDEIQASNRALNSLKYFAEQPQTIPIAAAGSLLGIRLSGPRSFPVGKVHLLDLHPLTFPEFLAAIGQGDLRTYIARQEDLAPLPEALHGKLIGLLRTYLIVGGMPEPVDMHVGTGDLNEIRKCQSEIVRGYRLDFAKYAPTTDIPKLSIVWDSIPSHLSRENRKFMFSALRPGARARGYENAVTWLQDAGLLLRSTCVSKPGVPLSAYSRQNVFKLYALDVGLLGSMARLPASALLDGNRLFEEFRGALVENYVAQQLVGQGQPALHYWKNERGSAEVDFICEVEGEILPLEVKAGINPRAKSLRSYAQRFAPTAVTRTTLRNLRRDGEMLNIPLYMISEFSRLKRLLPRN